MIGWLLLLSATGRYGVQPFDVEKAVVAADIVAVGRVVEVREDPAGDGAVPRTRIRIRVTKELLVWNGTEEVTVWFPTDGTTSNPGMKGCVATAAAFPEGTKVLVYGHDTGEADVEIQACWAGTGLYKPVRADAVTRLAIDQHGHALSDPMNVGRLERHWVLDPESESLSTTPSTMAQLLSWDEVVSRVRSFVPPSERWMARKGVPRLN